MSSRTEQRGFTIVEVLVYAAGMALLVGAICGFLFYMYGWYRTATISPRIDQAAITLATRLEGDLRSGSSISSIVQDTANGTVSIISAANSVSTTTVYTLSNGRVTWQQNGGSVIYLTPADLDVTGFYLHQINNVVSGTAISTAVRFEIDIAYAGKNGTTTDAYSALAILRESYQ
jgi:hypothetical protein